MLCSLLLSPLAPYPLLTLPLTLPALPRPPARCGIFLHSPFPSSEIFRTFPRREEIIRSMLNADLIGVL